ncbi:MAG: polysaccharide pyruvyl transferase family protein [Nitrososphaerales archaeon]
MIPRILVYENNVNLGDTIQAIALSRWFTNVVGINRDANPSYSAKHPLIVSGFLYHAMAAWQPFIYAGIHIMPSERDINWFAEHGKCIGVRDPITYRRIRSAGIKAYVVGCPTLTFDRYDGPRSGEYAVDCEAPGIQMTHTIKPMRIKDQWLLANEYLDIYRKAALVHTSRLHVVLPCLAFGTPVRLVRPKKWWRRTRLSIARDLGCKIGEITTTDVSHYKRRYLGFLRQYVDILDTPREFVDVPEIM